MNPSLANFRAETSALVVIDLQKMILGRETQPRPSSEVLATSVRLADAFRDSGGLVVLVRVCWSADLGDRLTQSTDAQTPASEPPAGYDEIAPELKAGADRTVVISKRQWGAFYGTELEMQLRRRGIDTIFLCGISTNFGVESTARDGWERGFQIFFIEDATASFSIEAHEFAFANIFPRLGHVVSSSDVLERVGVG